MEIDFNKFKLVPASLTDYPIVQNMARFYVYDMSEFLSWPIPADGLYECIDFKKYWETEAVFPFLIRHVDELVGFAIVDKKGSAPRIDFNMAQFFILRKFKAKGVGKLIAYQCFDQFKGMWEVMVIPGNLGAYHFWRTIITEYSAGEFTEYNKVIPHLDDSEKIIFKFKSRA